MTIRQLEYFSAIIECGSVSKAAQSFFISPQAMLQQLNLLEKSTGFPLFVRSFQGVKPTPEGLNFYNEAKKLLNQYEALQAYCRSSANQKRTLRICNLPLSAFTLHYIELFKNEFPDVSLDSFYSSTINSQTLKDVASGVYDLAEWFEDPDIEKEGLVFTKIIDCTYVCIMENNHPLSKKEALALSDLKGVSIFSANQKLLTPLIPEIMKALPDSTIKEYNNGYQGIHNICMNNNGIILSFSSINTMPHLVTIPLISDKKLSYGFVHYKKPSKLVRGYIAATKKFFREQEN